VRRICAMVIIDIRSPRQEYVFSNKKILREYQKAELYQMMQMENGEYLTTEGRQISTNFGIFGSRIGSGKTRTILALIELTFHNMIVHRSKNQDMFSINGVTVKSPLISSIENDEISKSTVIIVPNYLVPQWQNEMDTCGTTYSYNKADNTSKVILVSASQFSKFATTHELLKFRRIIVDEPETIKIKGDQYIKNSFIWFVGSTHRQLFHLPRFRTRNAMFANHFGIFGQRYDWIELDDFIVMSCIEWVKETLMFERKVFEEVWIKCRTKYRTGDLDKEVGKLIMQGDYTKALIEGEFSLRNINEIERQYEGKALENIRLKMTGDDEMCIVCYDPLQRDTNIVVCNICANMYCPKCACGILKSGYKMCAICKVPLDELSVYVGDMNMYDKSQLHIPSKLEAVVNIVKANPSGKYVVLDNTWEVGLANMSNDLWNYGIKSRVLCGKIESICRAHDRGDVDILLINKYSMVSGLNIQWVSDIIIYNQPSQDNTHIIDKITIGRCPDDPPLKIHYLFDKLDL